MANLEEAVEQEQSARHILSVSGGKDSAALALYMKSHYGNLPMEYVFCDTGAELPETYAFLDSLEAALGQTIARLNALSTLAVRTRPGRTAFDYWLREVYGGFLPNPRSRWCTRVLKIRPFEEYVGSDTAFSYIGIRWDEDRAGYRPKKPPVFSERPNIIPVYPFKDDRLTRNDILAILDDFGLSLPAYYQWRSRSGCFFCFYQQIAEWQNLRDHHPELFEAARGYESVHNGRRFTWTDGKTLDQLVSGPKRDLRDVDDTDGCAICHL